MLKKLSFLLVIILIAGGCSVVSDQDIMKYEGHSPDIQPLTVNYEQYHNLFAPLYNTPLSDEDVIGIMVSIEIKYSSENGEYWKSSEETWNDKSGDCEDFCTLFLGVLMQEDLYDGQTMIVVKPEAGNAFSYHTKIADHKRNIEYELTGGLLVISPLREDKILKEYSYAEVMYQAYEHKRLDLIF